MVVISLLNSSIDIMIYKTIATFKYRGRTLSVREERVIEFSTPKYVLYKGRKQYNSWRYDSERDALLKFISAIPEFCHI